MSDEVYTARKQRWVQSEEALREQAEVFTAVGAKYWKRFHDAGIDGAVVWARGPEGVALFTRGEHADALIAFINQLR